MAFAYQLVQVIYWLSLSTWFGGVLFIALSIPLIVKTFKEADGARSLDEDQRILLAGTLVENLFASLIRIELICAGVLFLVVLAQWFLVDLAGANLFISVLRSALYLAAAIIAVYDWRVIEPRSRKYRAELIASVDNPEALEPAREKFQKHHQESYTLLAAQGFLLLGMIIFSAALSQPIYALISRGS
jgi:hypothetical protein